MPPIFYPGLGALTVTIVFFAWIIHRQLRQKWLSRRDGLRDEIREVLTKKAEDRASYLKDHPRESVKVIFELLGGCDEEEREALLNYLEIINFGEALDDLEIRDKETDYRLLVVDAAMGMEEGWEMAVKWLNEPGTWHWTAAIHALSYWPSRGADQVLVSELASLSERYQVVDRAFNQPIIGALNRRGARCQKLALDYLSPLTPAQLQQLVLMYFKEVDNLDADVGSLLEERLDYLWQDAGDELKADILSVAAKHGLAGLTSVAKEAIGQEVDFVQLWAVRLLAKCSSSDTYLDNVKEKGSPRAKREVDVLDSGS